MRAFALLLLAAGGAASLAFEEEFLRTYPLTRGGSVAVANRSGRIAVSGWERDTVEVRAVKRSRGGAAVRDVDIEVRPSDARLEIRAVYGAGARDAEVDLDIRVPVETSVEASSTSGSVSVTGIRLGAQLKSTSGGVEATSVAGTVSATSTSGGVRLVDVGPVQGRSTSGSIRLERAAEDADLETTSGPIFVDVARGAVAARTTSGSVTARRLEGRATLESMSGSVAVEGAAGPLNARSVSGGVAVTDSSAGVKATSTSGSVVIDGAKGRIEASSTSSKVRVARAASGDVELRSTSGSIEFGGTLQPGGRYEMESFSGGVTLAIDPGACGYELSAKSVSGSIVSDLDLTLPKVEGSGRTQRLEGVHGKGCARIVATSFSGNVSIRRAGGPPR